jgi:hypothetical protein
MPLDTRPAALPERLGARRQPRASASREWKILLLAIGLVQGIMFLAYPMGGLDDDQAYQRHAIATLRSGDGRIGNVRYNTGYALVTAPLVELADRIGWFPDRLVLLGQLALSSLIPLLIFDAVRRFDSDRAALTVALFVLLDPFALQWAHFALPVGLVALATAFGYWFLHRRPNGRWNRLGALLAGGVMGLMILCRINAAPLAAALILLHLWSPSPWRLRARRAGLMAAGCLGVCGAYLALIQLPSTGSVSPSCILGSNLLSGDLEKGMTLVANNGPATRKLLQLEALPPLQEIVYTSQVYPNWRTPGPWATAQEVRRFLRQAKGRPVTNVISFPGSLVYYLGPCPTDLLLRQVHVEAVLAEPARYAIGTLDAFFQILSQHDRGVFAPQYLPLPDQLRVERALGAGFAAVSDARMYTGQIVWLPGVWAYSAFFRWAHGLKWLGPLALAWAFVTKRRGLWPATLALIAFAGAMAVIGNLSPRTYGAVYPLTGLLLGAFVVWLGRSIAGLVRRPARARTSKRPRAEPPE